MLPLPVTDNEAEIELDKLVEVVIETVLESETELESEVEVVGGPVTV